MADLSFARAQALIVEAEALARPADRYLAAYQAAEQTALTLVSGLPGVGSPQTLWARLARIAPDLAEWAGFFIAIRPRALAVQAGATALISERDADDLAREAHRFLGLVSAWLGRHRQAVAGAS